MNWPKVRATAVETRPIPESLSPSFLRSSSRGVLTALITFGLLYFQTGVATAQTNPCDLNGDGVVTSSGGTSDVQLAINMTLGVTPCTANIVAAGVCNVVMVQRVVNAAMGGACTVGLTAPLHSASLSWLASTTPSVTYKVLRGTAAAGPFSIVASSLSATTYTDTTVQAGATYYYVVRAVAGSVESVDSNAAVAAIPTP